MNPCVVDCLRRKHHLYSMMLKPAVEVELEQPQTFGKFADEIESCPQPRIGRVVVLANAIAGNPIALHPIAQQQQQREPAAGHQQRGDGQPGGRVPPV